MIRVTLTLWQRDGDDDAVSGTDPQALARHRQRGDPHEGEAQFAGACDTNNNEKI